jgi:hypothetical protein
LTEQRAEKINHRAEGGEQRVAREQRTVSREETVPRGGWGPHRGQRSHNPTAPGTEKGVG